MVERWKDGVVNGGRGILRGDYHALCHKVRDVPHTYGLRQPSGWLLHAEA